MVTGTTSRSLTMDKMTVGYCAQLTPVVATTVPSTHSADPGFSARVLSVKEDAGREQVREFTTELARLSTALAHIERLTIEALRTNSRDIDDWREEVAYLGKLAKDALKA
jgi:hypothetical protein